MRSKLDTNLKNIKDIGKKNLGKRISKNSKDNMRGALIGGAVGVVLGIASRKNPYIFGLIGLIAGRFLLSK